jgi:hypothetical protein
MKTNTAKTTKTEYLSPQVVELPQPHPGYLELQRIYSTDRIENHNFNENDLEILAGFNKLRKEGLLTIIDATPIQKHQVVDQESQYTHGGVSYRAQFFKEKFPNKDCIEDYVKITPKDKQNIKRTPTFKQYLTNIFNRKPDLYCLTFENGLNNMTITYQTPERKTYSIKIKVK